MRGFIIVLFAALPGFVAPDGHAQSGEAPNRVGAPVAVEEQGDGRPSTDSAAPEGPVAEAIAQIRAGKVKAGLVSLKRLGESGEGAAYFHLGEIYRLGVEREPAPAVAVMYYRLASRLGHGRAALSLANMLYFDIATKSARQEALALWQERALMGNAEAHYMLGMLYWNGESLLPQDPIRGYGLVWRAAQADFGPAHQAHVLMRKDLSDQARAAGEAYAARLEDVGFPSEPLGIDLLLGSMRPAAAGNVQRRAPESWDDVWHLEVGFALEKERAEKLRGLILGKHRKLVGDLASTVRPAGSREGKWRLVFGPMADMQEAVTRCVALKKAGQDCFARPPK
ncbi:tetratricopeptide repeat protein [Yunchengibacter salinarum]|uniref:tetratricopeptide repeat protein n=1 Tax=Yunchengibacter salinarum TaxID=3133399 RepID=UPI0035B6094D